MPKEQKSMTDQQKDFIKYRLAERARGKDEEDRKAAVQMACNLMSGLIHKKVKNTYGDNPELHEDMVQAGKIAVIEKLPYYDAYQAAPTTFFGNYIDNEIRQVKLNASGQTKYYAGEVKKLNRANKFLMDNGIPAQEHFLMMITGFSLEHLREVSWQAKATDHIPYEDRSLSGERNASNKKDSPLSEIIKREGDKIIWDSVKTLEPFEQDVLSGMLFKKKPNGQKHSVSSLAKLFHCSIHEVKKTYNRALGKLYEQLSEYYDKPRISPAEQESMKHPKLMFCGAGSEEEQNRGESV